MNVTTLVPNEPANIFQIFVSELVELDSRGIPARTVDATTLVYNVTNSI